MFQPFGPCFASAQTTRLLYAASADLTLSTIFARLWRAAGKGRRRSCCRRCCRFCASAGAEGARGAALITMGGRGRNFGKGAACAGFRVREPAVVTLIEEQP